MIHDFADTHFFRESELKKFSRISNSPNSDYISKKSVLPTPDAPCSVEVGQSIVRCTAVSLTCLCATIVTIIASDSANTGSRRSFRSMNRKFGQKLRPEKFAATKGPEFFSGGPIPKNFRNLKPGFRSIYFAFLQVES